MPLTEKGSEIMSNMREQYGEKRGKEVFYASKNSGTISGVDQEAVAMGASVPIEVDPALLDILQDLLQRGLTVNDCKARLMRDEDNYSSGGVGGESWQGGRHSGYAIHADQAVGEHAVQNPVKGITPSSKGAAVTTDKKRFVKAFRDAVREGLPLDKCIEMGVISGETRQSSKDKRHFFKGARDFRTAMRDAIAKGTSLDKAIRDAVDQENIVPPVEGTPGM